MHASGFMKTETLDMQFAALVLSAPHMYAIIHAGAHHVRSRGAAVCTDGYWKPVHARSISIRPDEGLRWYSFHGHQESEFISNKDNESHPIINA
jgi:hypothetical protein